MKISLRKASALQNAINETIKGITFNLSIRVSEFQEPEVEITKANNLLKANIERTLDLTNALYSIRGAVAAANAKEVDELLTKIANTDKNLQIFVRLAETNTREDAVVLRGKVDRIRNRSADARSAYGYSDDIVTTVVDDSDLAEFRRFIAAAKKEKQKLQDQLLEANVRTEIELDANVVKTLTAENLL